MKAIPDRWLDYKPYGTVIKNTKILAFKVPLKSTVQVPPAHKFTIPLLVEAFPKLKFVIDLTNTTKYYDKNELTSQNIGYLKIMVPGRQVPPESCVLKFFKAMDSFLSTAKNGEIIGVHCTHGLNRTGYLICRYLVQQLGWKADDAVDAFQGARGHPIERQEYVKHMKSSSTKKINTSSIDLMPQSSPSGKKSKSDRRRATESWDHPPTGSGFPPHMGPMGSSRSRESWGRAPPRPPPPGWGLPPPFVGLPPSRMGLPPPAQGLPPPPGPGFPGPKPDMYRIRPSYHPQFSVDTGGPRRPLFPASRPPKNEPRSSTQQPFGDGFVNLNKYNSRTAPRNPPRPIPNGEFNSNTCETNFHHSNGSLRRRERRQFSRSTY